MGGVGCGTGTRVAGTTVFGGTGVTFVIDDDPDNPDCECSAGVGNGGTTSVSCIENKSRLLVIWFDVPEVDASPRSVSDPKSSSSRSTSLSSASSMLTLPATAASCISSAIDLCTRFFPRVDFGE